MAPAAPPPPPSGFPPGGMQPPAPSAAPAAQRAAPWGTGLPATPPPDRPARGIGRLVLIAATVLCLVAAGVGIAWYVQSGIGTEETAPSAANGAPLPEATPEADNADPTGEADSSASASRTPSTSSAPATTSARPRGLTEPQALAELEALRTNSLPRLALDGRWVAQVASKSVGITDPLQIAANGTNTFYAVDILAESRAAASSVSAGSVLVLRSTDFGKRSTAADGQAYWITLVDAGFSSSDQIRAWCASTYPTLSAEQLANACAARTLVPPYS